jgi:hypothetical protein
LRIAFASWYNTLTNITNMPIWPRSSKYLNIIQSKRAEREKGLTQAPLFTEDVHGVYVKATGAPLKLISV